MGAVGVAGCLELPTDVIAKGIEQLTSVPGRLEKVENNLKVSVLVDYAHTPDALEKVLGAVRPLTQRRVLTVFGCGGDRDRGKRPLMGAIAERLADQVILANQHPRTEKPETITDDIRAGMQKSPFVTRERAQAIAQAIDNAAAADI